VEQGGILIVPSVSLFASTPHPAETVFAAARICYSGAPANEAGDSPSPEKMARLLTHVRQSGHLSTFEHASFTFAVDGISRVCSHQLVRHRVASYSQKSQRYVPAGGDRVVVPPSVGERPEARELFDAAFAEARRAYERLLELGVPKEDARFILPHGMETSLFVTMNARELLHFFSLRLCRRAQWEIRSLAREMLRAVLPVAPELFGSAGPGCLSPGGCTEGVPCGRPYESQEALLAE
jgi:thymidylate synthase (FAD)